MRTATYTHKTIYSSNRTVAIHCTVTEKTDGKLSFSIPRTGTSSAQRYSAKLLGEQIVKSDFKHEAVTSFKEEKNNLKLYNLLCKETEDLKTEYIQMCEDRERSKYKRIKQWVEEVNVNMYDSSRHISESFYRRFNIEFEPINTMRPECGIKPKDKANHRKYTLALEEYREKVQYISVSEEIHVRKAKEKALLHYETSTAKLAHKLLDKGITDESPIEIISSYLKMNFECTIKSGDVVIRAWTILAAEDSTIVTPHFRYLVK